MLRLDTVMHLMSRWADEYSFELSEMQVDLRMPDIGAHQIEEEPKRLHSKEVAVVERIAEGEKEEATHGSKHQNVARLRR